MAMERTAQLDSSALSSDSTTRRSSTTSTGHPDVVGGLIGGFARGILARGFEEVVESPFSQTGHLVLMRGTG